MGKHIPVYSIESLRSTESGAKDFDLFRFEYFASDIEHLKVPHRHHFYTFILVTGGSGKHAIDFHDYPLVPGRLFLIAPDQVHAWIELKKVKGFVLLFNDSFMALSKGRKVMSSWPLFRPSQPNFIDLDKDEASAWLDEFISMEKEFLSNDEFMNDALFYSTSLLLVRASRLFRSKLVKGVHLGSDFLFNFQELIEENFLTLKTPKDYAVRMNVTPNYLNALCKKKSGKSAGELIRQRILLEAKRLLAHTKLSASEIAFKLNFQDNSYFGRFFKKSTGLTPDGFRQKHLN